MKKKAMEPGAMLSPLPAVMVTCGVGKAANIITIGWTGIINSEPAMTYISVRPSRHSHSIIEETGEFVINLTTQTLAQATDFCGVRSGREIDKFKETGLTPVGGDVVGCPMIAESPVNIECRVTEKIPLGSHDLFMAKIEKVHVARELIDSNGKIHLEKAGLIAYCHGEYFPLKERPIGRFGFSVMKAATMKRLEKAKMNKRRMEHAKRKA